MLGFAWRWNRLPCLAITTSTHSYHQCQAQPCPTRVWWDSPVTSPLFVNQFKDMGIPQSSKQDTARVLLVIGRCWVTFR